jgi:hypothetical protein
LCGLDADVESSAFCKPNFCMRALANRRNEGFARSKTEGFSAIYLIESLVSSQICRGAASFFS